MWSAFIGDSTPKAKFGGIIGRTNGDLYPDTDFERLNSNQLVGRTIECGGIYGEGTLNNSFSTEETVDTISAIGGDEYDFSGVVWTEISTGEFELVGGSGGFRKVFYRYTDNLSLRYTYWSGAIGSSSGYSVTVSACEISNDN